MDIRVCILGKTEEQGLAFVSKENQQASDCASLRAFKRSPQKNSKSIFTHWIFNIVENLECSHHPARKWQQQQNLKNYYIQNAFFLSCLTWFFFSSTSVDTFPVSVTLSVLQTVPFQVTNQAHRCCKIKGLCNYSTTVGIFCFWLCAVLKKGKTVLMLNLE